MSDEPMVIVVQTCRAGHETAYAVQGVSIGDPDVGTRALGSYRCGWFDCADTGFTSMAIYGAEMRDPAPPVADEREGGE